MQDQCRAAIPPLRLRYWTSFNPQVRIIPARSSRAGNLITDGKTIRPEDLNFAFQERKGTDDFVKFLDLSGSLTDVSNRASRAAEKVKIKQALELSNWNKTQAAEMLEVSYKTLLNKVKEYQLE